MPILTPTQYRESYQLYEGKPCITDTAVQCRRCLDMRLHSVGKTSAAGVWGDPASFLHPIVGVPVPHDLSSPALAAAASADFHEVVSNPRAPSPPLLVIMICFCGCMNESSGWLPHGLSSFGA